MFLHFFYLTFIFTNVTHHDGKEMTFIFLTKFVKNCVSVSKQDKSILPSNSAYLNWSRHHVPSWLMNFAFLDQIFTKWKFLVHKKMFEYHYRNQHIRISQKTALHLKEKTFYFLNQICPKMILFVQRRTSEHYHRIQHIRINLQLCAKYIGNLLSFTENLDLK